MPLLARVPITNTETPGVCYLPHTTRWQTEPVKLSTAVLAKWRSYYELRDGGQTVELAAARAGLSPSSAYRYERGEESSQGMRAALALERGDLPTTSMAADSPVISESNEVVRQSDFEPIRTTEEGQKALKDFAYFRFRYFGRKSMPWQVRAAEQVAIMLSTKDREYVVMNEPPGSGKSTLFSHDVLCWMICRDRTIRIQIGVQNRTASKNVRGPYQAQPGTAQPDAGCCGR